MWSKPPAACCSTSPSFAWSRYDPSDRLWLCRPAVPLERENIPVVDGVMQLLGKRDEEVGGATTRATGGEKRACSAHTRVIYSTALMREEEHSGWAGGVAVGGMTTYSREEAWLPWRRPGECLHLREIWAVSGGGHACEGGWTRPRR